ncbi:MAG: DUF1573 domain-containing protein [Cyclobacteriaceae bacterium]|nr:DUF1573 domain-containing protein [Cyclobacteriaceae bacterium]
MGILRISGIILFFSFQALGQQAELLRFQAQLHDFGEISEEGGQIEHEFRFENISGDSVKIIGVKASCGCTTPGWSHEVIPPGGTGFVKAKYNPFNRPGPFNKNLTVTLSKSSSPVRLYIKGNVIPRPRGVEDDFPTKMGSIRVKYRSFNMGRVQIVDAPIVKEFEVYNEGDTIVTFLEKTDAPDHIDVKVAPSALAPKEKGIIMVSYYGKKLNDLGYKNDNVTLYTDEEVEAGAKVFNVYASVEDYFPPMTAEALAQAPKVSYSNQIHNFGTVNQGETATTSLTLTNVGKEDLIIRKLEGNCTCITAVAEKENLKPGETTRVEVQFNTAGRRGRQHKAITIYTNSPINPVTRFTIQANISLTE